MYELVKQCAPVFARCSGEERLATYVDRVRRCELGRHRVPALCFNTERPVFRLFNSSKNTNNLLRPAKQPPKFLNFNSVNVFSFTEEENISSSYSVTRSSDKTLIRLEVFFFP